MDDKRILEIRAKAIERYGNDPFKFGGQRDGFVEGYKAALASEADDIHNVISIQEKPDNPTEAIDDAARAIYQGGEMLRAVKYLNKYTNMKLKEAKEYADSNY